MLANLRALFGVIVDIILLRRGPEQLPASPSLLAALVALSIAEASLLAIFTPVTVFAALLQAAVGVGIFLLWFRTALNMAGKLERFTQMMTALLGVNVLFIPVILPLAAALLPYADKHDPQHQPPAVLTLIMLAICAWALFVEIRIVKATFEWPAFVAFLLLVGEVFTATVVGTLLFGVAPNPG